MGFVTGNRTWWKVTMACTFTRGDKSKTKRETVEVAAASRPGAIKEANALIWGDAGRRWELGETSWRPHSAKVLKAVEQRN